MEKVRKAQGFIPTKARHARSKHALKHRRAHSKVGNSQFGITSCARCGGDVAVTAPRFMGTLRLCDGCLETAERWALAQSIVQRNKPVAFGTHHEKHGIHTSKVAGAPKLNQPIKWGTKK